MWLEGWEYNQEGTYHYKAKDIIPVPPFEKPKDELIAARLQELRRLVALRTNESGLPRAYARLISELVLLGRLHDASDACRKCIDDLNGLWCLMALAELDLRRGSTAGLDEFAAWIKRSPSFRRYFALALLERRHGKNAEALSALREAVKHTLDARRDEETDGPQSDCYDSALFAYRNGQHDLALSICDKWEQYVQGQGYGDQSYHALRAASYLARGRQPEAVREVARAIQANGDERSPANDLGALERAIQAGDRNYVYEPGQIPPDDRIFLDKIE